MLLHPGVEFDPPENIITMKNITSFLSYNLQSETICHLKERIKLWVIRDQCR